MRIRIDSDYMFAVIILGALIIFFSIWAVVENRNAKLPDPKPKEHFHIEKWNGHDWVVYRRPRSAYAHDFGLAHSPDCDCFKNKVNSNGN